MLVMLILLVEKYGCCGNKYIWLSKRECGAWFIKSRTLWAAHCVYIPVGSPTSLFFPTSEAQLEVQNKELEVRWYLSSFAPPYVKVLFSSLALSSVYSFFPVYCFFCVLSVLALWEQMHLFVLRFISNFILNLVYLKVSHKTKYKILAQLTH